MYKNKVYILTLIIIFIQIKVFSQKSYLINFKSEITTRKIDSIKIENLTNKTSAYILGNEPLILSDTVKTKKLSVKNIEIKNKKPTGCNKVKAVIKYKNGDLLKFTAFSGKAKTVVIDIPKKDKTINFYFADCVDIDGNSYAVMKIGNQLWMVDNLKTTRYNNGDTIPNIIDNEKWSLINYGAYRNYFNNDKFVKKYGRLYNWFAVSDMRGLAPKGWRIPDKDDWNFMENTKMTDDKNAISVGSPLKEAALTPAGYCDFRGGFANIFNNGYWWLSTSNDAKTAWYSYLLYYNSSVSLTHCQKNHGFSVRCVKDINRHYSR